ncbi:murein DD-endopeptidase MepM/ murein hydrolase activator NlpD [Nocardia tenerifensis]|uniref:Murein DD-endopeptidase MepM/ murein hydrolase activator NlpD n=1 Tax=Nocardia tenerifensis TaxID=228006 RepID=A0A318KJA0_9NOCA|nr:murein DD-endopeptidase MepM/ murein hydrolase activator NlpD [Nocardia tenerifensis]
MPSVDRQRNSLYGPPPAREEYGSASHADYGSAAPRADYDFRADAGRDSSWTANESWSQQDSWAAQDSWSDGGAWNAGEAWADHDYQAADNDYRATETGCWAPEESWATEAEPEAPATPTVIPARRTAKRGGAHRLPAPPAALKGRAAVAAVAAGAVVAAGQAAFASPEQPSQSVDYEAAGQIHEIAAQSVSLADPTASPESPQVLNVSGAINPGDFNDILQKGQKYAQDLAAQEAAKLRPLFTKFAAGTFTSGYGARWGVQHLGVDIAGPIGTPIVAVADGTVIEAGPAAGFGMWVRLLHDDGTITIYGHIDTATVSQGQRVMAGDQIATIGNRGFSTGPHCHFEVWLNGTDKIDPIPWLATRGISLGSQRD